MAKSNANSFVFVSSSSNLLVHIGEITINGFNWYGNEGSDIKVYDVNDTRDKNESKIVFSAGLGSSNISGINLQCQKGVLIETGNATGTLIIYSDRKVGI